MSSSKTAMNSVFICSGSDSTRYSFVSHLSAALERININVIEEKDDPPTESNQYLSEETQAAIARSKVCVVVLSEDFSLSKSSLSTLVEILDWQHDKNCVTVVPVFYRVQRSVVEQQSEKLHDAFSEPEEHVRQWLNALKETTQLEGALESQDGQSDLELVEKIVTYVHGKLFPTDKIGINTRIVEIENLISNQSRGIRMVGIWGMAGIGKTTIADAVFSHMKGDYKSPRFIKNFEKLFQKKGLHYSRKKKLPQSVIDKLDINKSTSNQSPRKNIVFLVLDDVRNPLNAESFLGGFDWFDPGSVIIITSRDKHVLLQCRVGQIYEVKNLDVKEAFTLFSECAFGEAIPQEGHLKVSEMVVKYANGNPKALSYYGTQLKGKTPEEMETAFFKLRRCPPSEILEMFKSSYDELSDNEKHIFLDIACFFSGKSVEHVTQALEGRGLFVPIGIEYLFEKSLVTKPGNRVEMHQLIQDVAYNILQQEIKNQQEKKNGKCSRLCGAENIIPLLQDESKHSLVLKEIESILLDVSGLNIVANLEALKNMCNLHLLKIYSSNPEQHPGLVLEKGIFSLPSKLRLLHWENYPLQNLPDDFDPHVLVELNMPYSQLEKLWEGAKSLQSLKTISLKHSKKLVEINHLSEAQNLELIDLQGCISLKNFEATRNLELLQVLNLSGCVEIKNIPEEIPPSIKELYLNGTGISEIPDSIEALSKLVKLDLGNCTKLLDFLIKIYNMESLQLLNLSGCSTLRSFPEIEKKFENLQYLYLSDTGIQELHGSVSSLIGLKVLNVNRSLKLPENLKGLKDLRIEIAEEIEDTH